MRKTQSTSWLVAVCCGSLLALAGCGGSSTSGTSSYHGIIAAAQESGTIAIVISNTSSTATGTVTVSSASTNLTGTYSSSSKALALAGGSYSFTGTLSNRTFSGIYIGPKGAGQFSALSDEGTTVTSYCGTYSGSDSGVWNLTVDTAGNATGAFSSNAGGGSGVLTGTVNGSGALNVTFSGGSASGTISGGGSWTASPASGSWTVTNHC